MSEPNLAAASEALMVLTFREAAEDTPGWLKPLNDPRHPWRLMYFAAQNAAEGGLEVIAERQALLERIQELEEKVARLRAGIPLLSRLPVVEIVKP